MFQARPFVLAAGAAVAVLLVVVTMASLLGAPSPAAVVPLTGADGAPIRVSALAGEGPTAQAATSPLDFPVLLVKVARSDLEAAREATGQPVDKWAIAHPEEPTMVLLAYHAKSTHLGCVVQAGPSFTVEPQRGVPFLRIMDPCHQGQWNALAMAVNLEGSAAPRPLGVVPIVLGPGPDPVVHAGPRIDQERPFDAARVDLRLRPPS